MFIVYKLLLILEVDKQIAKIILLGSPAFPERTDHVSDFFKRNLLHFLLAAFSLFFHQVAQHATAACHSFIGRTWYCQHLSQWGHRGCIRLFFWVSIL